MATGLTKDQQKALEQIATPVDARGSAARAYVGCVRAEREGRPTFAYRVHFAIAGGREIQHVGPEFPYPRQAIAFARALNERTGLEPAASAEASA